MGLSDRCVCSHAEMHSGVFIYYSNISQGWQTSFPVMVAGRPCSPATLFCCGPYIRVCHSVICTTTSASANMCVHYIVHFIQGFGQPMHVCSLVIPCIHLPPCRTYISPAGTVTIMVVPPLPPSSRLSLALLKSC